MIQRLPDLSKSRNCVYECSSAKEILDVLNNFIVQASDREVVFICQSSDGHVGLLAKLFSSFQSLASVNKFSPFYRLGVDILERKFIAVSLRGGVLAGEISGNQLSTF